ncbi:MAG: efflux RND transporter permease subunit [Parabacteroides merdae]
MIEETIGTLETSLSHEILICIIVIIVLVLNLRASVVIASMLPIAVLSTFIIMRYTGIAANMVALSGIAIAIGVMVTSASCLSKASSGIWRCRRTEASAKGKRW